VLNQASKNPEAVWTPNKLNTRAGDRDDRSDSSEWVATMRDKPAATWREIGMRLNVSASAVQTSHDRLLIKLRQKMLADPVLRDWVIENTPEKKIDR